MSQKVVIITGAGRGIGAATAKLLGTRDYAVCVNYHHSKKEAEALAASLPRAIAVQADIADEAQILRLFDTVEKQLGPIDALVNNAGTNGGGRMAIGDTTLAKLTEIFAANVFGLTLCCREAAKRMKGRGGSIVNVSSTAAVGGGFKMSAYAASKAAVSTLTIGLASELGEHNIRVNAVAPGIIATDQNASLTEEKLRSIPLGRAGTPEEVAEAIAWLLSDAASYVSGSVLPVSGGR